MENNGVVLQRCNAVLCHLASPMSTKLLVNIYFLDSNMFQLENFHLKRSQPHSCFCFNAIGTCIPHCFGHACDVLFIFSARWLYKKSLDQNLDVFLGPTCGVKPIMANCRLLVCFLLSGIIQWDPFWGNDPRVRSPKISSARPFGLWQSAANGTLTKTESPIHHQGD